MKKKSPIATLIEAGEAGQVAPHVGVPEDAQGDVAFVQEKVQI